MKLELLLIESEGKRKKNNFKNNPEGYTIYWSCGLFLKSNIYYLAIAFLDRPVL